MPSKFSPTASLLLSLACVGLMGWPAGARAQDKPAAAAQRDGQHDFDFNLGNWTTHVRRLRHPLSGSTEIVELRGTVKARTLWDGRAQIEEIEADGPGGHWEALTLFLYDPRSHQWSENFANSATGTLTARPLIGSFHDGRGELYSQDTFDGKAILVRGVWSDITANSHRYMEDYSADGGRSWETVFDVEVTRVRS